MSPPPSRLRQVWIPPPPGMNNSTAPGVQVLGQATFVPLLGSTQWISLPRSPCGDVPAPGFWFGSPPAADARSGSGGGAPLVSVAAVESRDQPSKVLPLMLVPKLPVFG